MTDERGDFAFRSQENLGRWPEMTYGGALSFLRRRYSRDLAGVDVAISGIPYDASVTYRSGCRLGPRAIREASVQLAELKAFPFGFDPFATLSAVDFGDCMIDPHHPETVAPSIEAHANHILSQGAKMLSFGGDHFVVNLKLLLLCHFCMNFNSSGLRSSGKKCVQIQKMSSLFCAKFAWSNLFPSSNNLLFTHVLVATRIFSYKAGFF